MHVNKVTLPLSPTDMVEFFKDKEQHYEIDVDATLTDLNERAMLLYLSNLGIKCSFSKVTPTLMKEYMTMKDFVNAPMLQAIHANILYFLKYFNKAPDNIAYKAALSFFDFDEMSKFILDNQSLLIEQCVFLDSFLLYAETRKKDHGIEYKNVDKELHDELGFSLLSLLTYEDFMIIYHKEIPTPMEQQIYYTKYFDEYMFKGKNLFHYAHKSPLFGLISLVKNEEC